jgi:4-hydroxybenzoate polyprenyltransferase
MLVRSGTCAAGAVVCLVGAHASSRGPITANAVWAAASIAFLVAFAQVVNDVFDRDLDARTKPFRPLPAGALSVREAKGIAASCAALGIGLAAAVPVLVPFAILLLVLSWAYSRYWKDTVLFGNVLVAAVASCSVAFGAVAAGGVTPIALAVQAAVFAFSCTFEVLKTGVDVEGDAAAGLTTAATRLGVRTTSLIAAGLAAVAVVAALVPALLVARPGAYLVAIAVAAVVPTLTAAVLLLARGRSASDLTLPFRLLRVAWTGGVLALVLL